MTDEITAAAAEAAPAEATAPEATAPAKPRRARTRTQLADAPVAEAPAAEAPVAEDEADADNELPASTRAEMAAGRTALAAHALRAASIPADAPAVQNETVAVDLTHVPGFKTAGTPVEQA